MSGMEGLIPPMGEEESINSGEDDDLIDTRLHNE